MEDGHPVQLDRRDADVQHDLGVFIMMLLQHRYHLYIRGLNDHLH